MQKDYSFLKSASDDAISRKIDEKCENAPVLFTAEDVITQDDDCNEVTYPDGVVQDVLIGLGNSTLIGVLFIGLKLTNYITWPWIWVVSPLWILLAISISILVINSALVALETLIAAVIDYINWR